jgi:hypothetical protein
VAFDNNQPPVEKGRVAALVELMARKAAGASGGTGRVGVQPVVAVEDHREGDGASGSKSIFKSKARPSAESDATRMKVGTVPAAPNAAAIGAYGNAYGLTWPQDILYDLTAKKIGDDWVPVVKSVTGRYSRQVRLVTGLNGQPQQDIPNAGVATQANYQNLLDSLQNLGVPATNYSHYSLAAVQAHEDQHANRVRLALENVEAQIKQLFEAITVPIAVVSESEAAATARIQADPRYNKAVDDAFDLWDAEFDNIIAQDHAGNGPCETAERRVTTGLFEAVHQRAIERQWIATPGQKAGTGAPVGTVAGIRANIGNQPAPTQKDPLNLPPKAAWPPKK